MKIAVSACLLGENCKYSGGNNLNQQLLAFLAVHEVVPICPEVLGGLPTPRKPAELVNGKAQTQDGHSVDRAYHVGAEKAWQIIQSAGAQMAILQPRSPSCGCREIYDGTFSKRLIPGSGIFAALAQQHGLPVADADQPDLYRQMADSISRP